MTAKKTEFVWIHIFCDFEAFLLISATWPTCNFLKKIGIHSM